jgi:hypothetical protein
MQPLSPLVMTTRDSAPNFELLRRAGWSVNTAAGSYCVAWRGRDEVVFEWREEAWRRIGGTGSDSGL